MQNKSGAFALCCTAVVLSSRASATVLVTDNDVYSLSPSTAEKM
jgi:hypothetical protein